MWEIIRVTAEQISGRIDAQLEARAVLGGRQMEQTIMRCMPLGILFYIECSTPGYFDSLYHNPTGVMIMSGCLLLYLAAYAWGELIMERIGKG